MSIEQKVAQMIQGEIAHVTPDDMKRFGLGSVLNGGGSFPDKNKYASLQDWVGAGGQLLSGIHRYLRGQCGDTDHLGH